MANLAYLCATNRKVIYPSYGDRPYSARKQTVATEPYCVPLLWLALFRASDLVRRTLATDCEAIEVEAPLCPRARAIRQLGAALPYLGTLFYECGPLDEFGRGPLDEFATLFRQALEPLRYRYLTIELEEIAVMAPSRQEFYDTLRAALRGIGRDYSPASSERFVYLAQLFKLRRFPPPRLLLDAIQGSDDDHVLHGRILGSRDEGRNVPWYPE